MPHHLESRSRFQFDCINNLCLLSMASWFVHLLVFVFSF